MIVTEKEAATKVCSRVGGNASPNGDHRNLPPMWPCVASRCMAWRVRSPTADIFTAMKDNAPPKGDGWVQVQPDDMPKDHADKARERLTKYPLATHWKLHRVGTGFCGMAGTP